LKNGNSDDQLMGMTDEDQLSTFVTLYKKCSKASSLPELEKTDLCTLDDGMLVPQKQGDKSGWIIDRMMLSHQMNLQPCCP